MRAGVPLLLSPFVLAELDHMLGQYVGRRAGAALLGEVAAGTYQLEPFSAHDVALARDVIARYADLHISLGDASLVVLAQRHRIRDVLTLDHRHFRALRILDRQRFRLLPGDA
jgi:predicted nucleic acid-binding protein